MRTKEKQEEINNYHREEAMIEALWTKQSEHLDRYIEDNKSRLVDEFIEARPDEWREFCSEDMKISE